MAIVSKIKTEIQKRLEVCNPPQERNERKDRHIHRQTVRASERERGERKRARERQREPNLLYTYPNSLIYCRDINLLQKKSERQRQRHGERNIVSHV